MNRRNLIKSIPLLGFAPFVQAEEYPWPLECTLLPFQREIWEAHNKHDKNLFILPRGAGKTFLYNRFYEIQDGKESSKDLRDELTWDSQIVIGKSFCYGDFIDVFATPTKDNQDLIKLLVGGGFHLLKYSVYDLKLENGKPLMEEPLIEEFRKTMPEEEFRRQMLCEFV